MPCPVALDAEVQQRTTLHAPTTTIDISDSPATNGWAGAGVEEGGRTSNTSAHSILGQRLGLRFGAACAGWGALAAFLGFTASCVQGGDDLDSSGGDGSEIPLRDEPILVPRAFFIEDSLGVELSDPDDIIAADGSIFVTDAGNNRIAVIRNDTIMYIGDEGAGPGELRRPSMLQVHGDVLYVLDYGNGRLVMFSQASGDYIDSRPIWSSAGAFAVDAKGRILTAAPPTSPFYIVRDDSVEMAPRPVALRAEYTSLGVEQLSLALDRILVTEDAIHVLDNFAGALLKFDHGGALVSWRRLPVEAVREQRTYNESIRFGGRQALATSLTRDFSTTTDGDLLIWFGGQSVQGYLVDARDYTGRTLQAEDLGDGLLASRTVLLDSPVLYLGSRSSGLMATRLPPWKHGRGRTSSGPIE